MYSLASAIGCGSVIGFNKMLTMYAIKCGKTVKDWRELNVIELSLQFFAPVLDGSHVKWFTDNQAAAKL